MKPEAADNQRKRLWPRSFSLRLAMILLTIFAVGLGILGAALQRAVRQSREDQRIVNLLVDLAPGGYDIWTAKLGNLGPAHCDIRTAPYHPRWLGKLAERTGLGTLERVVFVQLSSVELKPQHIVDLNKLSDLRALHLLDCRVPSDTLRKLPALSQLEILHLGSTPITDSGLEGLESFSNLRALLLLSTRVNGPGLEHLRSRKLENLAVSYWDRGSNDFRRTLDDLRSEARRGQMWDPNWKAIRFPRPSPAARLPAEFLARCPQLRMLALRNLNVTDDDLRSLNAPLESLSLSDTLITDASITHLSGNSTMKAIDLGGTHITDASLKVLATCMNLESVSLGSTWVTESGLRQLAVLPKLKYVDVNDTAVTPDTARNLMKSNTFKSGAQIWCRNERRRIVRSLEFE